MSGAGEHFRLVALDIDFDEVCRRGRSGSTQRIELAYRNGPASLFDTRLAAIIRRRDKALAVPIANRHLEKSLTLIGRRHKRFCIEAKDAHRRFERSPSLIDAAARTNVYQNKRAAQYLGVRNKARSGTQSE